MRNPVSMSGVSTKMKLLSQKFFHHCRLAARAFLPFAALRSVARSLLFPGRDIGCLCGTGCQPQVEMLDRPDGGDLQRRSLDESRAAHPHPESSVQQRIVEPGRERMQFHQVERQRIGRVFVAVVPHHGIGIGQGLVG